MNRIVLIGFGIIVAMVLLLGTVSYTGIHQIHVLHERNQQSYATMNALQAVEDAIADADAGIRSHFSGSGWHSHEGDNAAAIFEVKDNRLNIDVVVPGVTEWDIQFFQGPFPLVYRENYIVTFEARSTVPREIQIVLENGVNYRRHMVERQIIDTEWRTYTLEFVMHRETDVLMQLGFQLGNLSNLTPAEPHRVEFDNISVIESSTQRQLIKNGDFMQLDINQLLDDAASRIRDAVQEALVLTEGYDEQQRLLSVLGHSADQWYYNNEVLILNLNAELMLSGRLGVGLELQSREANLALAAEISSLVEQVESIEQLKLTERESEAAQYRLVVNCALSGTLLLIVVIFAGLYRYFNRSIVRPIERTTGLLRDLTDLDGTTGKTAKQLEGGMDSASAEVQTLHRHIAEYVKILHNHILIDGLTGIFNRKGFDRRIGELLAEGRPFALILLDIDHFKRINDRYGHLAGDEVLRGLAAVMTEQAGADGYCFRYGGEEFGVLLPGHAARAYEVAERIREGFAATLTSGIAATLSAGIAASEPGDTAATLIERADQALYEAKSSGRNQTAGTA